MGLPLALLDDDDEAAVPASSLAIVAFALIEYSYGQNDPSGQWYYAPQICVAETTGVGDVEVLRLELSIPGFGGPSPPVRFCSTPVGAGQRRELIGERYGDYELAFYLPGSRATGGDATAVITYGAEAGYTRTIAARGPIVPGAMPATYTRERTLILPIDPS